MHRYDVTVTLPSRMGVRMRAYRMGNRLTTQAAAERADITPTSWAAIEHGLCCTVSTADRLAVFFGLRDVDAYDEILTAAEE